ncbi:viroplasmin family protein [Parabacteroides sp. FAFU027]|uniref:ribonuclease H1 domain-containing protein n=1 Tax=Parabacteroides sp. FAFU027 TaxID=2922715 RepID=UPI001FAF4377|nr:viroplasmin family protein [Parabacteroides sp. FAFU027]
MSSKGTKYYVVWEGHDPGIYHSWAECKSQVDGYEGAKYKSFATRDEAEKAFEAGFYQSIRQNQTKKPATPTGNYIIESIAVDASCLGNPGVMEYRGVYVRSGQELFRIGPYEDGTNNIGEFLAIVHGLALLKQKNSSLPIYSDSISAIAWVRNKKCKTQLEHTEKNGPIFDLIERAEKWLANNTYSTKIMKWETQVWGEIPADFGRK